MGELKKEEQLSLALKALMDTALEKRSSSLYFDDVPGNFHILEPSSLSFFFLIMFPRFD